VNNAYRDRLEAGGMTISGTSPDGKLVEMIEVAGHPWFIACQFHPELKSRPMAPAPLFASFIEAAARHAGLIDGDGKGERKLGAALGAAD
jgi:CTP synthase